MNKEELKIKLDLHIKWLNNEIGGIKLNLSGANLSGADLSDADLSGANLSDADLAGADLSDANLRCADLSDANLSDANLAGTDLSNADLSNADLSGANLAGTDLSGANLSNANLSNADLRFCIGNNKEVKSLQIGTYLISYTKDILNIGCKSHTLDEWKTFTDDEISRMDTNALEWWNSNKFLILTLVERECTI